MYLYQPCLMTLSLYAWAYRKDSLLRTFFPLGVLALSWRELAYPEVQLLPSALLLPFMYLIGRFRAVAWDQVLTAALLGGALCWRVADAWPLLPGLPLILGVLLFVPVLPLCREREDRLLACSLGSLVFELFFCLREYVLFSFCVVRLGSRGTLDLAASALCLYAVFEQTCLAVRIGGKGAVSTGK